MYASCSRYFAHTQLSPWTCRPQSWLSSSRVASSSVQTRGRQQEAILCVSTLSQHPRELTSLCTGEPSNRQADPPPRSYLLLPLWFSSRHAGPRRCSPLQPATTYVRPLSQYYLAASSYCSSCRQTWGHAPSVSSAANIFQKVCYDNKDALSAGIIVAGWDAEEGGSVYNIPLGGGLFRQPWAIGGTSF
jgi:hypothetical protein